MIDQIRLYFSDVSKLHAEILFDLSTGRVSQLGRDHGIAADVQARLHVHGSHGLKYSSGGGEVDTVKPPTVVDLFDGDTFIIRKKLFRFEYGHEEAQIETPPTQTRPLPALSPARAQAPASPVPSPAKFAAKKRASFRMSLVPSGKSFEPLASPVKDRRHSIIGLGEGPQVVRTPKKSALANEIQEEDEEEPGEEEVVIEACDGEEGDVLYIEARESEVIQKVSTCAALKACADLSADPRKPLHDATAEAQGAHAQHQRSPTDAKTRHR